MHGSKILQFRLLKSPSATAKMMAMTAVSADQIKYTENNLSPHSLRKGEIMFNSSNSFNFSTGKRVRAISHGF